MYRKYYDNPPITHHAILQALEGSQNGAIYLNRQLMTTETHAPPVNIVCAKL